jgi:hypothetical protein
LARSVWEQAAGDMHNNELHNLYSLPLCRQNDRREMHIYSENLAERDRLEDLGLGKRIIKFWKELIAYFPLI